MSKTELLDKIIKGNMAQYSNKELSKMSIKRLESIIENAEKVSKLTCEISQKDLRLLDDNQAAIIVKWLAENFSIEKIRVRQEVIRAQQRMAYNKGLDADEIAVSNLDIMFDHTFNAMQYKLDNNLN